MTRSKEYKAVKNYVGNELNIEEIIRVTIADRVDRAVKKLFESYRGQEIITQAIWAAYRGDNKPYSANNTRVSYEAQRSLAEKFRQVMADAVTEKFDISITLKPVPRPCDCNHVPCICPGSFIPLTGENK